MCLFICNIFYCKAQLLSWSPAFITDTSSSITITCDASQGNQGLYNYATSSDVYVHIGLITSSSTSSSNWLYVPTFSVWGSTNAQIHATYIGNNKWQYTIAGGLRSFFGVTNPNEKIQKIAILFRNGTGSLKQANSDAADMYIPVYAANTLFVRLDAPARQPEYAPILVPLSKSIGDNLVITANASQSSTINLFFNGTQIGTSSNAITISQTATIAKSGTQTIVATAVNGGTTVSDTSTFFVSSSTNFSPLPSGVTDGINYESGDTSVVLVLYAPHKTKVSVIGDFNNWTQSPNYQMNETPDSLRYWLRITGLTPGTEYGYQYVIDGSLILADYNTEKVLDKANDPYIPSVTYPNLKSFPAAATGNLVSVLQTAKPAYNWQVSNFSRPDKRNLVIYELWIGNFTAAQNYQALKDTLTYLKRLGVNAIELMPVNEFEGNTSWGYNPNFYFAPDKYYGTENALRQFIDACHLQGMAVIMDIVMNHSFGSSPMVQMYWNSALSIPAANNPWFNQYTTHADNVGYQFNHQTQATIDFRNRVITHWLTKYKIDGFRWDMAKGFTQTNTCDATGNKEVKDILSAVDYTIEKGIADPEKLGICGWSYGGILTDYLIATDTRFKAASSGAGVAMVSSLYGVDQFIMQYDNELGVPWKNIDKYLAISYPFLKADKIKTPTQFMVGENDFNVPSPGSEQMYQALRSLGTPTELIIYPGQFHGITVPSYLKDRFERYIGWFDKYLK